MNNTHYKLVINNKKKILLSESLDSFKASDYKTAITDLYNIITRTVKAVYTNLMAQVEWMVISKSIRGFANLESALTNFRSKMEESNKMFESAIPESIRGNVDMMFNISNPGAFVTSNLVDTIKSIDKNNIPFGFFADHVISGRFFESDVRNWGEGIGPFKWVKFNNLLWYNGWLYKDLIINNVEKLRGFIQQGGLSQLDQDGLSPIRNEEDLKKKVPIYSMFMGGYEVMKSLNGGQIHMYDFFKKSQPAVNGLLADVSGYASKINNKNLSDDEKSQLNNEFARIKDSYDNITDNFFSSLNNWAEEGQQASDTMAQLGSSLYESFTGVDTPLSLNGDVIHDIPAMQTGLSTILQVMGGDQTLMQGAGNIVASGFHSLTDGMFENKKYKLVISNHRKLLKEDEDKNLKKIGIDKSDADFNKLNDAQKTVLENIMKDDTKNKYLDTWKKSISKLNEIKKGDSEEKKVLLFLEMAEYSSKFFSNLQGELKNSVEKLQKKDSEESKNVNDALNKKFNFELTPKGFAEKSLTDFNLLCQTTKNHVITYLMVVEPILKEFDLFVLFLSQKNNSAVSTELKKLKSDFSQKISQFKSDKEIQKTFDDINKKLSKEYQKESQTLQNFKSARENSIKVLEESQKNINEFCENLNDAVIQFEKMSDFDKIRNLLEIINLIEKNNNTTRDMIYKKFLPNLLKQKKMFTTDLFNQKQKLNKNYAELLRKMDLTNFDTIYNHNKKIFDNIYDKCKDYIGTSYENSKFKKNEDLLAKIKKEYEVKKENLQKEQQKNNIKQDTENVEQNDDLGIDQEKQELNKINPISVK